MRPGGDCSWSGLGSAAASGAESGAIGGGAFGAVGGGLKDFTSSTPEDSGAGGPGCGGKSFTAATKVLTASGGPVAISKLVKGQEVLAVNTKTGKNQAEPVAAVLVHYGTDLYDLTVKAGGHTEVVHTTSSHLFWDSVTDRWVKREIPLPLLIRTSSLDAFGTPSPYYRTRRTSPSQADHRDQEPPGLYVLLLRWWRSPSATSEDRNHMAAILYILPPMWRSPLATSEDRNKVNCDAWTKKL